VRPCGVVDEDAGVAGIRHCNTGQVVRNIRKGCSAICRVKLLQKTA
jgi:hypothetical protein